MTYIEILNQEYIKNILEEQERETLISENNIEKRDVKGYHGREILELLQNADDAYKKRLESSNIVKNENVTVLIEYKDNILTISNSGTTFDRDGVKAIVQGNNSPKGSSLIGNKGTGFRSVLNWVNKVQIFSGEFNLEFSTEFASNEFEKIKEYPQIQKQLNKKKNLHIPMLSIGKDIKPIEKYYDTVIKLYIKHETQNDDFNIERQINNIDENLLLFLPCIDEIDIRTEKSNIRYKRLVAFENNYKSIEISKINYKNFLKNEVEKSISSKFYLFEREIKSFTRESGNDEFKDLEMAIAIPQDNTSMQERLIYSYFPIHSFQSPFNCIMHATFLLDDQRNNIISSDVNKAIFAKLLEFLIEISRSFLNHQSKHFSLSIVTPFLIPTNLDYGPKLKLFEYSDKLRFLNEVLNGYIRSLASEKLFPNVMGEYLSFTDGIRSTDKDIPDEFVRIEFNKLLGPIEKEASQYLLKRIADDLNYNLIYSESELLNIVNSISEDLTIDEQINIFLYWNKNYKNTLPKLIKTQKNDFIDLYQDCYFLVGDVSSGIPSWVKVPAIHSDYQTRLLLISEEDDRVKKYKQEEPTNHITRIISQNNIYPLVKFNYRDRSNIITTINSSVDSYNKSVDFLKWLWKHYRMEDTSWNPPFGSASSPVSYQFPSSDRNFVTSKKMFFGKSHGYPLNNRIFSSDYKELVELSELNIDMDDYEEVKIFLSKFGVMRFPKIELKNIKKNVVSTYKDMILEDIESGKVFDLGRSNYTIFGDWYINHIDNLENVLLDIDFLDIINWISSDNELRNELMIARYYNRSEMYIECKGNLQNGYRRYQSVPNYILFLFNNTPWIEINGNKHCPIEILNGVTNRQNIKFNELVPVITQEFVKSVSNKTKIDIDNIINILGMFDLCEYPTDLPSHDFYKLMISIPELEFNKAVELSLIVYRKLESHEFDKIFEDSGNKKRFFKDGKILVNYMNSMRFVNLKDAYCPSINIIDKKGTNIVAKGQRTSNNSFFLSLGCQKYESSYEVVEYTTSQNHNHIFQEEFDKFIYYAKAYSEHNEKIKKEIDKLEICLVSDVKVIESNTPKVYDEDYTILKKGNKWFVLLKGDYNRNKMSECIENIFANIANTPGFNSSSIGELFRQKNQADREFLIIKEFGSIDILYRFNHDPIKENFSDTIKNINPNFNYCMLDNIKFENMNSADNFLNIKNILLELNLDIEEFIEHGFIYKIDANNYNLSITKDAVNANRLNYKNWLYASSLQDKNMQNNFLKRYKEFLDYKPSDIANSIFYDPISHLLDVFGDFTKEVDINCETYYDSNYTVLNPDKLFEDEIQNDQNAQTYIYFNNSEAFKKWLLEKKDHNKRLDTPVDKYKSFKDVIPKINEEDFKNPEQKDHKFRKNSSRSVTDTELNNREKSKKEIGNIGELLIYNLLCNKYGKNKVIPKSEAFVKLEIIKPGQASSGDYDLSYIDLDEIERFVEVKSSDGELFYITSRELEFAKDNPDKYKVFLVFIDKTNPEDSNYKELPYRFWENDKFILHEVVEKIECKYNL